jgi:pimeloyl-ACP methyl ester carboxylesterase
MKLKHEVLRAPGSEATSAVVMLHGILGSGSNLRGLARSFLSSPEGAGRCVVLMDLRAHGGSLDGPGNADTVKHAADDVVETLGTLPVTPYAVVGHSFGGKVALALEGLPLSHVMTLDSAPGPRTDARGSEKTMAVLEQVRALALPLPAQAGRGAGVRGPTEDSSPSPGAARHPLPAVQGEGVWSSRDAFIDELVRGGQTRPLAQWLAMNLERTDAGFRFKLDLTRIDALLGDYLHLDLWPVVERASHVVGPGPRLHLVIALQSKVYEHDDRVRAQSLESESVAGAPGVTVDLLEGSHWIHTDNPTGVVEVMRARL